MNAHLESLWQLLVAGDFLSEWQWLAVVIVVFVLRGLIVRMTSIQLTVKLKEGPAARDSDESH